MCFFFIYPCFFFFFFCHILDFTAKGEQVKHGVVVFRVRPLNHPSKKRSGMRLVCLFLNNPRCLACSCSHAAFTFTISHGMGMCSTWVRADVSRTPHMEEDALQCGPPTLQLFKVHCHKRALYFKSTFSSFSFFYYVSFVHVNHMQPSTREAPTLS